MWTCYICVTMIMHVLKVDLLYMCEYDHARVIGGLLYMCDYDHARIICGPVIYV